MSRSYRHNPITKDFGSSHKEIKKIANRKVRRRNGTLPNGNFYRRIFPQYEVCDWWTRYSIHDWRRDQEEYMHCWLNLPKEIIKTVYIDEDYYNKTHSDNLLDHLKKRTYTVPNNNLEMAKECGYDWWRKTYYWK